VGAAGVAELRFDRGQADADDLREVVDHVFAELGDPDSGSARRAQAAGVDPADFAVARVEVRDEGAMVVAIDCGVDGGVVDALWEEVLRPRVEARLGAQAVGAKLG
jgi:hypothetical protein